MQDIDDALKSMWDNYSLGPVEWLFIHRDDETAIRVSFEAEAARAWWKAQHRANRLRAKLDAL